MIKTIARPAGYVALVGTIAPPLLFLMGYIEIEPVKALMLVSCVVWFVAAPFWMKAE